MSRNKRYARWTGVLLLAAAIAVLAAGCGGKQAVATYKLDASDKQEQQVTQKQFDAFQGVTLMFNPYGAMDPNWDQSSLNQLMAFQVLAHKAGDDIRTKDKEQAKKDFQQLKQSVTSQDNGDEQWQNYLKNANATEDDVQQYVETMDIVRDYMNSQITDQQVKDEYNNQLQQNKNAFDFVTVRHILIALQPQGGKERTKDEALKMAKEVKAKLDQGGDFAALAKQYSDDSSKDNGGEIQETNVNSFVENFKKAALELPLHQISDPVETEYGYHIIEVESRKTKTFDEVKDTVRSDAMNTYFSNFIAKDLPALVVETHLPKKTDDTSGQTTK